MVERTILDRPVRQRKSLQKRQERKHPTRRGTGSEGLSIPPPRCPAVSQSQHNPSSRQWSWTTGGAEQDQPHHGDAHI
ncbi:hypothetical protein PC116_g7445 [Phytophthora cactorum]|nr:hypothetical protein PC114_g5981 [Phytophthora cactorum]KAG3024687.1 hypothetical protein PC120_g6937 [Phytophthora cactorum]KAG3031548.1 hypothetical protein PC119_g5901 [Phytophthora cactorum]KAG3182786.1 hypothetical protein C6341_g5754 [Phytophthora cactorum]KAG4054507.1 hypothetical protein PC123_g10384 [Phytophthora cactorum]